MIDCSENSIFIKFWLNVTTLPCLQVAGNLGDVANTTTSQPERVHCEVCNITCNTKEVFEQHTQGKKHMKNMQKIAISSVIGPKVTPVTATAPATSVGELENKKHILLQNGASAHSLLFCQICNVVCNNQDTLQAHLAGKKHSSKVNSILSYSLLIL